MISLIEDNRQAIIDLCKRFGVARLELFGSAAGEAFDANRSDLDFLVEFEARTDLDAAQQYFGLLFALEALFDRKVDLVCTGAIRNRYFIRSVNATRKLLYAA